MQLKATVSPEEVRVPEIFPVEAELITFAQATPDVASPPVQTYPFVDLGKLMICVEGPAVLVQLNEPTTAPPVSAEVVAQPPVPVPSVKVVPPALNWPTVSLQAFEARHNRPLKAPGGVQVLS